MRLPKTIKGWILLMREIECHSIMVLKGFDSLPIEDQEMLKIFDAEISNHINEVKSYSKYVIDDVEKDGDIIVCHLTWSPSGSGPGAVGFSSRRYESILISKDPNRFRQIVDKILLS